MQLREQVAFLTDSFASCTKILTAIGDETRQHLIVEMMRCGECSGIRVGRIAEATNLSRPAVSHHLQIMKDAGLVKVRKEGTKNYYYFDPEMESMERLIATLRLALDVARALPDRSGNDTHRPDEPTRHEQQ